MQVQVLSLTPYIYIIAGYVRGQTIRLITWETEVRILHPQPFYSPIAQLVERSAVNGNVGGSEPSWGAITKKHMKKIILSLILLTCLSANAVTVYAYNITKQYPIVDSEIDTIRPIASITKLMTALVLIESGVPLNEKVPYKGLFYTKNNFTREELLNLMLVKSDNRAAEALAESMGGKLWTVYQMNKRAIALEMYNTKFDDVSGLSAKNTSTARDLVIMLTDAYKHDKIREISALSRYDLKVVDKKNKEKHIPVNNTNVKLMNKFDIIEVSKTGTTNAAGKCLVMIVHKNEQQYAIVILGGTTRADVDNLAKNIMERVI